MEPDACLSARLLIHPSHRQAGSSSASLTQGGTGGGGREAGGQGAYPLCAAGPGRQGKRSTVVILALQHYACHSACLSRCARRWTRRARLGHLSGPVACRGVVCVCKGNYLDSRQSGTPLPLPSPCLPPSVLALPALPYARGPLI